MANKRKKQSGRKGRGRGLNGVSSASFLDKAATKGLNHWQLAGAAAAVLGGGLVGVNIGKWSGPIGLVLAGGGVALKNMYVTSVGMGMIISKVSESNMEGIDGFSFETIKQRSTGYFKDIAEKFIPEKDPLPSDTETTSGLNGQQQVKYFINPNRGTGELDLTELDNIQRQIAQMNSGPSMGEIDYTSRNF